MKVSGCVFQNNKIKVNTDLVFDAEYKGKSFFITTDHGFGVAKYDHLKRFMISVYDIKKDIADVDTWKDYHTIEDAIRYGLVGAGLLELNREF